jgi:hypothetical protein
MKLVHAATKMFLDKTGHSKLANQPNGTVESFSAEELDMIILVYS